MYINILHDTSARRPQCKPGTLHSLFLYSDPSPPTLFPTVLMAQTNSKPNLFPYNTQTCPQPSSFYTHLPAYEDGTDTMIRNVVYKIQKLGNYPEESIQQNIRN